ncbi:MAG: hypothetical protein HC763_30520 [Hydrococcus sp. CRU_1_1]|nr:hypothetical protein [Hydrococcus sp. CRU_1_1]
MVFSKQKLNLGLGNILSQIQLQECLEQIQIIEPKPGQLFWTSNVSNPGVYLILEGKIRLLDQKENLIASSIEAGLGQISLFPEADLQTYMLRASLGLKLGYLDNNSLQFLFKRQPELKNLFYRQALQWDLLLLSDNVQNLLPILSFLQPYQLTEGVVSVLLPEPSEVIVLRRGKILHTSGVQLIPGKLYQTSCLPQDGEWAISKSTELFYSLNPVDRVQQPETIKLDRQLGKLITPRPKIDLQDNLPPIKPLTTRICPYISNSQNPN